ncbi:ABC transporter ATP-binding protein [Helicobacter sp.]|uniref:ABC transporter ATP-binding protein n=1 Tax=Helicobacter sp. TaxID=218 RepID=UPI0025BEF4D9|nr:ABC transporter ATP-binding protein [Helicobacter sp.]MCI5968319.1 ABC transporter ATP-binding protein [Helicobacter sp.]MDY2584872.1 ABC transporter ATP-binding protein [Helicobacter sp.]
MLQLRNLKKSFGTNNVLNNLCLDLKKGEILSILGGSGSGKSTLLRIIAGLEEVYECDDFKCPKKVSMMFQNYALFPHLNVEQNILFALHDFPKQEQKKCLQELLQTFEIESLKLKNISQISGGQAQRVAFARAMSRGCELLLLDEPFSNLDQGLKSELRMELKKLIKNQGISAIMVTHDIEDAYCMSDKIALLEKGKIIDYNTPEDLYFHPKNKMSAKILPNLNIVEEALDLKDTFLAWINSKGGIFGYTEIELNGKFEAVVVEKEFLGAFYRLKLNYKNILFFMLVSSSHIIKEKVYFQPINFNGE